MGWENLLGNMFSSLFTQNKVTTALEKGKSNPEPYNQDIKEKVTTQTFLKKKTGFT